MSNVPDLCSLSQDELKSYLVELGEPGFRAKQVFSWLHQKKAAGFEEMSNLPKSLREKLAERASLPGLKREVVQVSKTDGTQKYLFSLPDGNMIESVLMRYSYGNSVCISSQVGCRMGCRFCASTVDGLARNLTAGEMLAQVYEIEKELGERISNVVVMGSGEPMDNYDNVVRFIRLLSDKDGLNISQRSITVSTCGLVPEIRRFAEEELQVTLALSLHAADDATRQRLMPIANRYALSDVLDASAYYFEKTGRRVSFEYSLVAGVNDTPEEAKKLLALLRRRKGHVNLIPVNPVVERSLKEPSLAAIHRFRDALERAGINVTIRKEMGRDIDGACGQLRRRYRDKKEQGNSKEE